MSLIAHCIKYYRCGQWNRSSTDDIREFSNDIEEWQLDRLAASIGELENSTCKRKQENDECNRKKMKVTVNSDLCTSTSDDSLGNDDSIF